MNSSPSSNTRSSLASIAFLPSYVFFVPLLGAIFARNYFEADAYRSAVYLVYCLSLIGMVLTFYLARDQIAQRVIGSAENTDWFLLLAVVVPLYAGLLLLIAWFVFHYAASDIDAYHRSGGSSKNLVGIYAAIQMVGFMSCYGLSFLIVKIVRRL